MKLNKLFFLIFLISFYYISNSQEPEFRVLGKRGNVDFQSKGMGWSDIKTGDQLFKNDKIKIGNESYLGLVHSSGKTVEIKKEGTYNISKLSKEISAFRSSTTKRFAKYIVDEITSGDDMLSQKKYKRSMENTGAVERATGGDISYTATFSSLSGTDLSQYSALNDAIDCVIKTDKNYIRIKYPRTSYVMDNVVNFVWYRNSTCSVYEFVITDRSDNVIYSTKTSDTSLQINLSELKLLKGTNYYWFLKSNDLKSDSYCFNWLNDYDMKRLNDDIEPILDEMAKGKDAASLMLLASVYEDENIMNRALDAYEDALSIEPDVDGYKTLYARYLSRIGLEDEALRLVK
ncbi:MAG: hypothetical protein EPN82_09905 [Bacteroidetes bacterium]|nr:MAG: hypothetical protein EPN82_09905 [Bacteroidota bacterium]